MNRELFHCCFIDKKFVIAAQLHRNGVFFSTSISFPIYSQSSGCIVSLIFFSCFYRLKCSFRFFMVTNFFFSSRNEHNQVNRFTLSIQLKWLLVICIAFYRISVVWIENIKSAISKSKRNEKHLHTAQSNKHLLNFKAILLHSFRIWRANRFHLFYIPWPNIMCLQYTQQLPLYNKCFWNCSPGHRIFYLLFWCFLVSQIDLPQPFDNRPHILNWNFMKHLQIVYQYYCW